MSKLNTKFVSVVSIAIILLSQNPSHAASKSKIESYYKKIYRTMATQGNEDALNAMTYYDVEVKAAIGRILDGKIKCDSRSKQKYKNLAYDTWQSEVTQFINGFYLGYCNSK